MRRGNVLHVQSMALSRLPGAIARSTRRKPLLRLFPNVRVLVTKPTIGGFGLNLQHCADQTYFPSHSYEQYYQSVRRCWRFGQKNPVTVDMITTDGQENVTANLQRKSEAAAVMFDNLVGMMRDELKIQKHNDYTNREEIPSWL